MIDHGHRRIGHFGDELAISTARERRRCFTDAMAAAGLFHGTEQLTADLRSEEEAISAVRRLMELPDPPTALFTSQNMITLGAIRALHQLASTTKWRCGGSTICCSRSCSNRRSRCGAGSDSDGNAGRRTGIHSPRWKRRYGGDRDRARPADHSRIRRDQAARPQLIAIPRRSHGVVKRHGRRRQPLGHHHRPLYRQHCCGWINVAQ